MSDKRLIPDQESVLGPLVFEEQTKTNARTKESSNKSSFYSSDYPTKADNQQSGKKARWFLIKTGFLKLRPTRADAIKLTTRGQTEQPDQEVGD